MLYENISYPNDLPFRIFFSNVAEENYHYHKELEMSFILRGTTHFKIHHLEYSLKEGNIIIVDASDLHRIFDSSDDILMLTIQVDLAYFSNIYPNITSSIFVCEALDEKDVLEYQMLQNKNKMLKRIITEIMVAYKEKVNHDILLSYVKNLVTILVDQFQSFVFTETSLKHDKRIIKDIDMQRFLNISNYLYTNYQETITLDTISNYLHLSPFYVSHLVKDVSGLSFKNFLNYVRVEFSEKLLAEQILTLTEICETCGFSSPTYFNKCFVLWHGKTPSQYRKELKDYTRKFAKEFTEAEALALLLKLSDSYKIINNSLDRTSSYTTSLEIDFEQFSGIAFEDKFDFNILVSSHEDVVFLSHNKAEILALKPTRIFLEKNFLRSMSSTSRNSTLLLLDSLNLPLTEDLDLNTINSKFSHLLLSNGKKSLLHSYLFPLTENNERLIYKNGLYSSTFHILKLLSNMTGDVVSEKSNFVVTNDGKSVYLLIYKTESQQEFACNISFKNAFSKIFVTEQRFENSSEFTGIINEFSEMKRIPFAVLNEINTSFHNKKTYILDKSSEGLSVSILKAGVILLKIAQYK